MNKQEQAKPGYGVVDIPINYKLGILQLADEYKFTEIEDNFDLFIAVFKIFKYENNIE